MSWAGRGPYNNGDQSGCTYVVCAVHACLGGVRMYRIGPSEKELRVMDEEVSTAVQAPGKAASHLVRSPGHLACEFPMVLGGPGH